MSRRAIALVAGGVAIAIVAVALVGVGVGVLGGGSSSAVRAPHYVEESQAAGVDHTYDGGSNYFVGGGVAVFDCNGDGRPEMYLAGGTNPAALYRNDSPVGGALRFTAVPDPVTDMAGVMGAYPIDIDGDGHVDLAVLRVGGVDLLRGLGDCRFERANARWSFDGGTGWTTAFSATWEGSATLPTIALGHYLKLDASGEPTFDCDQNALLRPAAGGTGYGPADRADARLLHAVDALQRLGSFGPARPAGDERPPIRGERAGTALARRARRGAPALHRCRRLGPGAHLGHGHRELRRHGRRIPRHLPHEPGRQQAPDLGLGAGRSGVPGHRARARSDGGPAVHRRRRAPLHRLAPGVRRT